MEQPLLLNFVLNSLKSSNRELLKPGGSIIVFDGCSLLPLLYPSALDWPLPPWKELFCRVKLFVQRFSELGFKLVVFFGASHSECGGPEDSSTNSTDGKKHLLVERGKMICDVLQSIENGSELPEGVYFTSTRAVRLALAKAFLARVGVRVFNSSCETSKAIALYCADMEPEIFAAVGTDLSDALLFPIPSLLSLHPSFFDWEAFWDGRPVYVNVLKRYQISDCLVPKELLPAFAALVAPDGFPRDRLQGFFCERDASPGRLSHRQVVSAEPCPTPRKFDLRRDCC
eukprot:RCo022359